MGRNFHSLRIVRDAKRHTTYSPGGVLRSSRGHRLAEFLAQMLERSRTQVFTVPSGSPIRSAISGCERPS